VDAALKERGIGARVPTGNELQDAAREEFKAASPIPLVLQDELDPAKYKNVIAF
jgi:hypothetical protein